MNATAQRRVESYLRAAIRRSVGMGSGAIEVSDDSSPPQLTGRSAYYTTPAGKPIRYPSAYRWPKVYHASTLSVSVGRKWIETRLRCPRGYSWGFDADGVYLRQDSTGEAYHPSKLEILTGARGVASLLRAAITRRRAARIEEKRMRSLAPLVMVTVEDSVRAGNCHAGTIQFARAAMPEIDIQADPYAGVRADRLLAIADRQPGRKEQIMRAVSAAIARETMVTI